MRDELECAQAALRAHVIRSEEETDSARVAEATAAHVAREQDAVMASLRAELESAVLARTAAEAAAQDSKATVSELTAK